MIARVRVMEKITLSVKRSYCAEREERVRDEKIKGWC